ncbi:hypothetical protein D3C87_1106170 [compost metagenome]|uniref:Uncharacterized protein n=1 Tax=Cupriavidus campinensis TaxID=151783 RepID=A0AAE9I4L3_9BURK|nr:MULTISPECIES: hypothetical protein [Cupriavidus]TSP13279.1 hypothetical protein FGG12_06385 [Cupriavidus campinensis]URF07638.1 hypothetical protein M5D45_20850 [Cupriavidus campinensis]CAG2143663.1 hypothetical protein LMG19282_02421 [Cupriavidus campinensis]
MRHLPDPWFSNDFWQRAVLGGLTLALAFLLVSTAEAKLPPPTAEQQQAAEAKKAKEAEEAKVQAAQLAQVQDKLAARFGKGPSAGGQTPESKLPQKAVEAPGSAGPQGGTSPSAEAHSGEAQRK